MLKYGFGLIGCGRISYKHIEAILNNHEEAGLLAVCDIELSRATEKSNEYLNKAKSMGLDVMMPDIVLDYRNLLRRHDIHVVSIATESGNHAAIAIEAMKEGKHVIVEKPMALSTEDADEMIKTANEMNVKLCVSHQNRYNPSIQHLREAVEKGRFGKIIAGNARILWNRGRDYYLQAPWRGTYENDGGCLMNQCIHNIDLLQWMLGGKPEKINGMTGNFAHSYIEAEDYGSIQIRFENQAIGNVEGTVCLYPKNLEETLTIIGEKGTVVLGGQAVNKVCTWQFSDGLDNLEEIQKKCNQEIENVYGWGHNHLYKDMIDSIRFDKKPYIDGEDGKKAMQIILCAYEAQKEEKTIKYEEKLSTKNYI